MVQIGDILAVGRLDSQRKTEEERACLTTVLTENAAPLRTGDW